MGIFEKCTIWRERERERERERGGGGVYRDCMHLEAKQNNK